MSEDIREAAPAVRVQDASFSVVRNQGRSCERWLFDSEAVAEWWAGKLRAAAGRKATIRVDALGEGRAA